MRLRLRHKRMDCCSNSILFSVVLFVQAVVVQGKKVFIRQKRAANANSQAACYTQTLATVSSQAVKNVLPENVCC